MTQLDHSSPFETIADRNHRGLIGEWTLIMEWEQRTPVPRLGWPATEADGRDRGIVIAVIQCGRALGGRPQAYRPTA